jgi:hypothetical protein
MPKTDEQLGYGAGRVYVLHAKCCRPAYAWLESAYKIGMTIYTAADRIKQYGHEVWLFSDELKVVHQIESDQIRILEAMFHQRYRNRMIKTRPDITTEWFKIDDKINGLVTVKSLYLTEALAAKAGEKSIRQWWTSMTPDERRWMAGELWRNPHVRIEYDPIPRRSHTPVEVEGLSTCPRCGVEFLVNIYRSYNHKTRKDMYKSQAQCTTCEKESRREKIQATQRESYQKTARRYPSDKPYTHCACCGVALPKGFGPCCSRECALAHLGTQARSAK